MSVSKVDIINSALVKIGAEPILSVDDDSKEAQVSKIRFDFVRQVVLRMHPWNCAIKRTTTSATTSTPDFDFAYQHQLPSDCIRILEVNINDDPEYRIEGRNILSDANEIELKYVYDLEDVSLMDSMLAEAIASYLAFDIAYSITQNGNVRDSMFGLFERVMKSAKTVDGQEDSRRMLDASEWVASRFATLEDRSSR